MYQDAIKRWMYWSWNFNSTGDFIQQAFGDEGEYMVKHLKAKFEHMYDQHGAHGVVSAFFAELDTRHRQKLVDFVMDNYNPGF